MPVGAFLVIVADSTALSTTEMPLLAVYRPCAEDEDDEDYQDEEHDEPRVKAEELSRIENSLSLATIDWEEFVRAADDDGVFRGFPITSRPNCVQPVWTSSA